MTSIFLRVALSARYPRVVVTKACEPLDCAVAAAAVAAVLAVAAAVVAAADTERAAAAAAVAGTVTVGTEHVAAAVSYTHLTLPTKA